MSGIGGELGNLRGRRFRGAVFHVVCAGLTFSGILLLGVLLYRLGREGISWVDWQFLSSYPSRFPEKAGVLSGLLGTLWLVVMTAGISVPVGVASALYLEEYAPSNRFTRWLEINLTNLAGVPSILYGMLGLTVFVRWLQLDRSLLAGALTLSLLILPVIIVASREAIRTVPSAFRHAAYALGATKWQTIREHVLPSAVPGILTGVILALSRAIGETAPLVVIGAFAYVAFVPEGPLDDFTTLPIQIFNWSARPQEEFHSLAAGGILVLLTVLLAMNTAAVWIRHQSRKGRPW